MIFIIEGPDGSGKSTLAEKLSKQTGYTVIHRSNPKSEEEKQAMLDMYVKEIKTGKNLILDRCWYSEMVYGPVMRDEHIIDTYKMYYLEKLLAKRGALVIYCTDTPETLWQRCTSRGEDYVTDYKTFVEICEGYEKLMSIPHIIPVVRYGYEDM